MMYCQSDSLFRQPTTNSGGCIVTDYAISQLEAHNLSYRILESSSCSSPSSSSFLIQSELTVSGFSSGR